MPQVFDNSVYRLIDQVEDLCRVYVGKNAQSEQWGKTCDRLAALDKLVKRVRRTHPRGGQSPTRQGNLNENPAR